MNAAVEVLPDVTTTKWQIISIPKNTYIGSLEYGCIQRHCLYQEGAERKGAVKQLRDELADARTRLHYAEARIAELPAALQVL